MYKTITLAIFTTVIMCAGVLAQAPSAAHPLPLQWSIETILAQAQVIHIEETNEFIVGTMQIMHVYCGPDKLLGKSFVARSPKSGEDNNGTSIFPPVRLGEKGIWELRAIDDKLYHVPIPRPGIPYPAREGDNTYASAMALAKVIEQVCKAESAKQLDLLRRYAFDRIPQISVWAIHFMSLADPQGRVRLFNDLISNIDSLSIQGQAALDEVLLYIGDNPWRTSERRLALLNKWVNKAMSKDDAML